MDAFKGWPVGMVLDHPQDCLFHFFKRGAVMVPDSKNSEWLYIVKTGQSWFQTQRTVNGYKLSKQVSHGSRLKEHGMAIHCQNRSDCSSATHFWCVNTYIHYSILPHQVLAKYWKSWTLLLRPPLQSQLFVFRETRISAKTSASLKREFQLKCPTFKTEETARENKR